MIEFNPATQIQSKSSLDWRSARAIAPMAAFALAATLAPLSSASAYTYNALYNFCSQSNCSDGLGPRDRLLMDSGGILYGTTYLGGANQLGTVFELVRNGGTYVNKVLHSFCAPPNCVDDNEPFAALIMDVNGNLYGTASGVNFSHETG